MLSCARVKREKVDVEQEDGIEQQGPPRLQPFADQQRAGTVRRPEHARCAQGEMDIGQRLRNSRQHSADDNQRQQAVAQDAKRLEARRVREGSAGGRRHGITHKPFFLSFSLPFSLFSALLSFPLLFFSPFLSFSLPLVLSFCCSSVFFSCDHHNIASLLALLCFSIRLGVVAKTTKLMLSCPIDTYSRLTQNQTTLFSLCSFLMCPLATYSRLALNQTTLVMLCLDA